MSIKICTHTWPSADIREDFENGDYIVMLRRYDLPDPRFGVHTLNISGEQNHSPFWVHTLGLYSNETAGQIHHYITDVLDLNEVQPGDADYQSVMAYVGRQVIPVEWKLQWSEGDPAVINRVKVWSA